MPTPPGRLEAYEISPAVNRADNDTPDLIAPYSADAAPPAPAAPAKREKKKDERQGSLF